MKKDFRKNLIKRLNAILVEIVNANETELDKIGIELLEIEKKLMALEIDKKN